jgi:hypothetical protein
LALISNFALSFFSLRSSTTRSPHEIYTVEIP